MKKQTACLFAALLVAASCGSSARFSATSQRFQDPVYSTPATLRPATAPAADEVDQLVDLTHESPVYILGSGNDTIVVPAGTVAKIAVDQDTQSTTINVYNNTDSYAWN